MRQALIVACVLVACSTPDGASTAGATAASPTSTSTATSTAEPEPSGSAGTTPVTPAPAAGRAGGAPEVQLRFGRISKLHRGFFGQEALVADLVLALAPCGAGAVDVHMDWDPQQRVGTIIGDLPAGSPCTPVARQGGLDLAPLVPFTKALAAYRDAVAGTSDFRIASFQVHARWAVGPRYCQVRAAGQHPPDGTRFAPCLQVDGQTTCKKDDDAGGVVRLGVAGARACGGPP